MGHCCSSTNNSNTSAKPTSLTRKMTNNSFINRLGSKKYNPLQGNFYSITKFGSRVKLDQQIVQPLKFHFKLMKFKGRMLKENNYYILKIVFDENVYIAPLVSGSNPKFLFEETIIKVIKYEDMEAKFLEIIIYNLPADFDIYKYKKKEELMNKARVYSGYKVDLLTIALGPQIHDMILLDKKTNMIHLGRISYTIICNHVDTINLIIESARITLNYLTPNDLSLKLKYISRRNNKETKYTKSIPFNMANKEEKTFYDFNAFNDIQNPLSFTFQTSLYEFRSADSTINLYSIKRLDRSSSTSSNRVDNPTFLEKNLTMKDIKLINHYSLIGISTLDFYTILSENEESILRQSSRFFRQVSGFKGREMNTFINEFIFQVFLNISQSYTEQIYVNGESIGLIYLNIKITNIPLIRQIMCGIMTESGFEINSIHLYDNIISNKASDSLPEDLQLLANQKISLETELMKLKQPIAQSQYNQSLLDILKAIQTTLTKSIEHNCLYYGYSSDNDLYTGQALILNIGCTLLDVNDKLTPNQRGVIFEILKLINSRAEFDLGTLYTKWFIENEESEDNIYEIRDIVLVKNKHIELFIEFNYRCLALALAGIARQKTYDNESKRFSEYFLSLSYFRLPAFRKLFIDSISINVKPIFNSNHLKVKRTSIVDFLESDPINNLILWDILFYDRLNSALNHLTSSNEIQEKLNNINKLLSDRTEGSRIEWIEKLMKRDIAFFNLVKNLDKFLLNLQSSKEIKWLNIPGYESILNALIHEIEIREIKAYPKQLMDLIPIFVDDISIVNEFIRRILLKTNVYDIMAVFNVITIIDLVFSPYTNKPKKSHPSKFNYNILTVAMKSIIAIDHSLCVAKFFWLYYKNAHLMSINHLAEICQSVFISKFYLFFFHWSWQVRNIFFYFILYIIGFRIKNVIPFKDLEDLKLIKTTDLELGKEYSGQIEQSFGSILKEKMKLITVIQEILTKENSDPSFNNILNPEKYYDVLKQIPPKAHISIVVSLHHFNKIQKEFVQWEKENRNRKDGDIEFPKIILITPKDDVVDYSL